MLLIFIFKLFLFSFTIYIMNLIIVTIIYVIFIIIELYLVNKTINYYKGIFIEKTDQEQKELDEFICTTVKKRVELLKTMSYKDWLEYNQKNVIVNYKNEKMYIVITEKLKDSEQFVTRVSLYKEFLHANMKATNMFVKSDSLLLNNSHDDGTEALGVEIDVFNTNEWYNGCGINSYLWIDPFKSDNPILKKTVLKIFKKEENGEIIQGIIKTGYSVKELIDGSNYYFSIINTWFFYLIFIFIYLVSVISYYINDNNFYESFFLFFTLNLYVVSSLFLKDVINNPDYEDKLVQKLDSSILGISFLVAANIFVIQSLKRTTGFNRLFYFTSFLFCSSLLSLMIAMFKITDFKTSIDIKTHRIQNQFFFNISIILNVIIFFNYFISISYKKIHKIFSKQFAPLFSFIK